MSKRFRGLTPRQQEVLGQIAFGHDGGGFHPKTLEALEQKGLIVGHDALLPGSGTSPIERIPMRVRVYEVPLAIHAEYWQWCADTCGGSGEMPAVSEAR